MEREIKFRAWDKEFKSMVEPSVYVLSFTGTPFFDNKGDVIEQTEKLVLMQYTGLKDKNGKEIYEGDLLRTNPINDWEELNYVVFEVFFHDNDSADNHVGFQFNRLHFQGSLAGYSMIEKFLPKYTSKMEVIGNIYENPELLK